MPWMRLAAALAISAACFALPSVRVVTVDGEVWEGALADMRGGRLHVEREGERASFPLGTVARIEFLDAPDEPVEPDEAQVEAFCRDLLARRPRGMLEHARSVWEGGKTALLRLAAERMQEELEQEDLDSEERRARWLALAAIEAVAGERRASEELVQRIQEDYAEDREAMALVERIRAMWRRRADDRPRRGAGRRD